MRLCKDCKHTELYETEFCTRAVRIERIDLRDGREIRGGWRNTRIERKYARVMARLTGTCGIEGRFWEKRA